MAGRTASSSKAAQPRAVDDVDQQVTGAAHKNVSKNVSKTAGQIAWSLPLLEAIFRVLAIQDGKPTSLFPEIHILTGLPKKWFIAVEVQTVRRAR